eukprot:TRINITY_DN12111_c0_g1_i4.p1 TRINITY_DN12111_c0_g1~~TRINITY_DN12111_c0_g1_i4.p1  ORF type:complete len:795 (-),score=82.91 TRINITY_DN12111_c0_g1_i4:14-2053(-)
MVDMLLQGSDYDHGLNMSDFFAYLSYPENGIADLMCLRMFGVPSPTDEDMRYAKGTGLIETAKSFIKGALTDKPSDLFSFGFDYFKALVTPARAGTTEHELDKNQIQSDVDHHGGVQMNLQALPEMAVSAEVPECDLVHRQLSGSSSARTDRTNLERGKSGTLEFVDQGAVEVQVEMAASGEGVCTVRLPCGSTIRDLKRSISDQLDKPMIELSLLLGPLLLTNDDARLADVFTDSLDGQTVVQLVLMTSELVLEDVKKTRKALSRDDPPIQEMIDAGIVPTYVRYLAETTLPELQFEAGWALTNITAGSTEQTRVVVDHGAVPAFMDQLASPHGYVQDQAVWALANIAGDSVGLRDEVLRAGALTRVLEIAKSVRADRERDRENVMWAVSNMVRGKPKPALHEVKPLLSCLSEFLRCEAVDDLSNVCWTASYLSDGSNDWVQAFIDTGCIPRVVELLGHESNSVKKPALRALGNVASGDDTQTQLLIEAGMLTAGHALLTHGDEAIRKDMCWTLSNITAGTVEQVGAVIESGLIPELLRILRDDGHQVQKEAFLAITNPLCGTIEHGSYPLHIRNLVDLGCLDAVLDVLSTEGQLRESVLVAALDGLLGVLQSATPRPEDTATADPAAITVSAHILRRNGRELMHELRNHPNEVVCLRSKSVLQALGILASSSGSENG